MASSKTDVIEYLFFTLKGFEAAGELVDPVVTFDDVTHAISAVNPSLVEAGRKPLKTTNPANFWKDITRHNPAGIWPASVLEAGFTGRDAIGEGERACFQFVPTPEGLADGFEPALEPDTSLEPIQIESLSMPLATKALGRSDENWLAQVAARLRVVETHFAAVSSFDVAEMTFLQTGIKLAAGEVDAAYSLNDSQGRLWLLAVEAKGRRDRIHVAQVVRAAKSLLAQVRAKGMTVEGVIPMALKVVGDSKLYVVEFAADTGDGSSGLIEAQSVISLEPSVPGIN